MSSSAHPDSIKKPSWIKTDLSTGTQLRYIRRLNEELNLTTVCEEATCPNLGECWNNKHATYMVMGKECSRGCKFCNVKSDPPEPVDPKEPYNIAKAVEKLDLGYVVITSVTRDDLEDYGLGHYLTTIEEIRNKRKNIKIELLIPDFNSEEHLLRKIANSAVEVIGHNVEMVPRLYSDIRPNSNYEDSLKVLQYLKESNPRIITKSALIVGFGESEKEIQRTLHDIANVGVDILHIGQYLRPSFDHVEVKRYYTREEFEDFKIQAQKSGINVVKSGPMVRSSYRASDSYEEVRKNV